MPLNKQELEKLLKETEIITIATTKSNGDPHAMPIWFIYHDGKIYFETDRTTAKFKHIQRHNKIALVIRGKNTYIVEGKVKWFKEKELGFPIRKMFWEKYGKAMDDNYITDSTLLFEVIPERTESWHLRSRLGLVLCPVILSV